MPKLQILFTRVLEESTGAQDVMDEVNRLLAEVEGDVINVQIVEIQENKAKTIAEEIRKAIHQEHAHAWYADYKNKRYHYIIFKNEIFIWSSTVLSRFYFTYKHCFGWCLCTNLLLRRECGQ